MWPSIVRLWYYNLYCKLTFQNKSASRVWERGSRAGGLISDLMRQWWTTDPGSGLIKKWEPRKQKYHNYSRKKRLYFVLLSANPHMGPQLRDPSVHHEDGNIIKHINIYIYIVCVCERETVCVCVWETVCVCMCAFVWERETVCVCLCVCSAGNKYLLRIKCAAVRADWTKLLLLLLLLCFLLRWLTFVNGCCRQHGVSVQQRPPVPGTVALAHPYRRRTERSKGHIWFRKAWKP